MLRDLRTVAVILLLLCGAWGGLEILNQKDEGQEICGAQGARTMAADTGQGGPVSMQLKSCWRYTGSKETLAY